MNHTLKKYITLFSLGSAGGVMYLFPYIRNILNNPLNEVLGTNNTGTGFLITIYGIVSLFLYIPGGILADKLKVKIPLLAPLAGAGSLLLIFASVLYFAPNSSTKWICALFVWGIMPIFSTFVFWSSLVKAINLCGDDNEKGRCFGIYQASNAICGTLINTVCISSYASVNNSSLGMAISTVVVSGFFFISFILCFIFVKEDSSLKNNNKTNADKFKISDVKFVLKNKNVWIVSFVMMFSYMAFTTTTYFTNYMTDVCKLPAEISGSITIFRSYFLMIFASILSGIIADRVFKSIVKWYRFASICFAITILIFMIFGFSTFRNIFNIPNNINLIAIISIIPGIFSTLLYSIQFGILTEIQIPKKLMGTATGLASMFVFSPDIFYNTILGSIIDKTSQVGKTEFGYGIIFTILIFICVMIAILTTIILYINNKSKTKA